MRIFICVLLAVVIAAATAAEVEPVWPHLPFGNCPESDLEGPVYLLDLNYRQFFFQCQAGKAVLHQCPKHLVFNPRVNVCDYPSQDVEPYGPVGDCPVPDEIWRTSLRDGANVAVFYNCWKGKALPNRCSQGEIYSTEDRTCTD